MKLAHGSYRYINTNMKSEKLPHVYRNCFDFRKKDK